MSEFVTQYEMKDIRPVICIPSRDGRVSFMQTGSIVNAKMEFEIKHGGGPMDMIGITGDPSPQRAHNRLVKDFLAIEGPTHMVMMDSTVAFHPSAFLRILAGCQGDRDIVAGIVPSGEFGAVEYRVRFVDHEDRPGTWKTDEEGFIECLRANASFMCIQRRVLEAMVEKSVVSSAGVPFLFQEVMEDGTNEMIPEDFTFCDKARAQGFRIWCDPSIAFMHQTTGDITGSLLDLISYTQAEKMASGGVVQ